MVDLMQAYDGVVSSSTDIIKNKQRHLYINMLDLLTTTTRAASVTSNVTINDGICTFWYSDILPICFDEDLTIQNTAIDSLETFVKQIDSIQFYNSPKWPELKQQIVDNYIQKLNTMRDESNCNWYKMWCLLIRILNQEIVRSAAIINTFLSVVEQGFRSPNYEIRAESFLCWKVLVEIFAQNHELISPKRIKLISIPLRSSHAKTMSAAINKFKVWWYFLLQLNDNIYNNCEMAFETFLVFCFGNNITGSDNNNGAGWQLKQFHSAKEMAVITLIEMLGSSHKEIDLLLEKFELEHTEQTLITESIMQKSYKYIMKACFQATLIIVEQFPNRIKLIDLLWRNLISQIIQTKNAMIYKECCIIIKELIQHDYNNENINIKIDIIQICNIFGTHYAFLMTTYNDNDASFGLLQIGETIIDFTNVLLSGGTLYFSIDNYKPIVKNIYDIEEYKKSTKYWDMIKNLIENLLNSDEIDNFNNFEIKLEIWKRLSLPIITYLDIKLFEFRVAKKAELINNWLFWPYNKFILTKLSFNCIKNELKSLDDDFFNIWKKIMISSSNAQGRSNFQVEVLENFVNLVEHREKLPKFQEILGCYITCWEKKFDSASATKEPIELIKNFLTKIPQKNEMNYNKIIEYLNKYFSSLDESRIIIIYHKIISLTKQIAQAENMKYITKTCFENYKKNIIEKLKSEKIDKKYLREFKGILKNSDLFTIIPKVWTLNPEKLTDHQVEKMKEKNCDIPALYNDINSHSQDTSNSIKPWTPNKIVITKDNKIEKFVLPGQSDVIINSPVESKTSFVSDDFSTPKPIESIINAYCEISDTNDSSSTITEKKYVQMNGKKLTKQKAKKMAKKKMNTKLLKISKTDEAILKDMNIQIDDEKKKLSVLRNLRSISIDTVEGNMFYGSRRNLNLDDNEGRIVTRRSERDKNKIKLPNSNLNKLKKELKASKKSSNSPNVNPEPINLDCDESLLKKNDFLFNNYDDDIVVSSQLSESLITRRTRKSSSSLSHINQTSKTTITESTEAIDNSINDSGDSAMEVARSDKKNQNINASRILRNKLIKITEMDTQLNTEHLPIIDLNTTKDSPITSILKTVQINDLLSSSDREQKKTISSNKSSITQLLNESSSPSNSSLSHNAAHELFIGKPKTSSSPQSESGKELKNLLSIRDDMQDIIDQKHDGKSYSPLPLNKKKKVKEVEERTPPPLQTSIIQNKDLKKMSELETQPNTEELLNNSLCENDDEMTVTPTHRKINIIEETDLKSPAYSPIKPTKKSINLHDKFNNTIAAVAFDNVDNRKNEFLNDSRNNAINKSLKLLDGFNNSIAASPECDNVNKKNEEFLNNTLNISPIQVTPYKCLAERDTTTEDIEIGDNFIKTKDFTEMIEKQQLSPIRKVNKPTAILSSPPDRKSTNNASSPGPKPKQPTPNFTGRGAQFINMIKNRAIATSKTRTFSTVANIRNDESKNAAETINTGQQQQQQQNHKLQDNMESPPTVEKDTGMVVFSAATVPETPQGLAHELLVFSKVLPSSNASTPASILKRKCCNDSIDDFESPATKRKRVSFHDPPVSATKEYVINDDEDCSRTSVRMSLNKFLQSTTPQPNQQNINCNLQQQQQQQQLQNSNRHVLKRKSRADSMMELLGFNDSPNKIQQKKLSQSKSLTTTQTTSQLQEVSEINNYSKEKNSSNVQEETAMDDLDLPPSNELAKTPIILQSSISTSTTNDKTTSSAISTIQPDDYEPSLTPSPQIYFPDEGAILKHIFNKYTIDEIFEKYFENDYNLNSKNIHNIIKEISLKMETDNKIKTNVLEMLSEKHPKEFLDHAIQENLSSVVCDRLNSSSVIDFVFEKSRINGNVRKIVFDKMNSIVTMERFKHERHEYLMTMLRNEKFTNDEILECIELITSKRIRNNNGRGDGGVVSTSQTVDSSSTY